MTEAVKTTYTHCTICVATCGLAVTSQNNKVIKVEPDKDNVFWEDFCIKAAESHHLIDHPLRIKAPMKRVGDQYVEVSYEQMLCELAEQLNTIIDSYGADSIGAYVGNPATSNTSTYAFLNLFLDAINTKSRYFVGSLDQNALHIVFEHMYNHPWAFIQTDVDNCQYLMMIGANPAVSEFGWLYSVSQGWKRALKAKEAGSTLVIVDPRKTESANKASEHIAPLPNTDWAFVLAILHVIFTNNWHDPEAEKDCNGFEQLRQIALAADLDSLSRRCDIPVATLTRIAKDFSHASSAVCLANTGVGQSSTGAITIWLAQALTLITGNMRRKGGMFHTKGAMNLLKNGAELFPVQHRNSRVRGTASVAGFFPTIEIADDINTPGEGQLKAFFIVGGNPVISAPQGKELDEALAKLDLLVCVDSFQRDSHRHAHWLIPAPHFLELDDAAILLKDLNARPSVQFLRKAVDKPATVPYEWQFFRDLVLKMDKPLLMGKKHLNLLVKATNLWGKLTGNPYDGFSPKTLTKALLKKGGATTYKEVENSPHGLLLNEEVDFNYFLDNLPTADGKVNLAPEMFTARLQNLLAEQEIRHDRDQYPFLLINKRRKHMMNSWMTHGSMQKMKNPDGDIIEIHPDDAEKIGCSDGHRVRVASAVGEIDALLRTTESVRPGVAVMGHGWGSHTFDPHHSGKVEFHGGVNRNLLVSNQKDQMDPLSGVPKLNGTAISILPIA
ncbi:MAG: molybdopterin-dependent oxidoreductase [Porticoccaceae bacterium]|nr:molybdopterin-dependent oxidoreductase [Porticoccaceae bacterium]